MNKNNLFYINIEEKLMSLAIGDEFHRECMAGQGCVILPGPGTAQNPDECSEDNDCEYRCNNNDACVYLPKDNDPETSCDPEAEDPCSAIGG